MRGNKAQSIAQSKKYVVVPKKQFNNLLKIHKEWAESSIGIRRDMRKLVIEEVAKEIGDKIKMIDGALTQTILMLRVFLDKGLITREEIDKKHKELKKK